MLFSCIFTQIFDFGYGLNICQFLNGDELVNMFQVNKECAETVVNIVNKIISIFSFNFYFLISFFLATNVLSTSSTFKTMVVYIFEK